MKNLKWALMLPFAFVAFCALWSRLAVAICKGEDSCDVLS
jgi:hypothetical protein